MANFFTLPGEVTFTVRLFKNSTDADKLMKISICAVTVKFGFEIWLLPAVAALGNYFETAVFVCKAAEALNDAKLKISLPHTNCGGCNLIPIEYFIADGKLKVPQIEFEKNAKFLNRQWKS